jgi:hypothetical protein
MTCKKNKTVTMIKKLGLYFLVFILTRCNTVDKIDLSGNWHVRLDEEKTGETSPWHKQKFNSQVNLPGSLRDNGFGNTPSLETKWTGSIYDSSWFFIPGFEKYRKKDSLKFPFWLTPVKRYVGAAWYQKEIDIPVGWKEKTVLLYLERPHWQTKIWVDTALLGSRNSLSTPHIYEIAHDLIKPGKHLLTICVDNAIHEIDPGINSHSITDHTQGNWNGIAGKMHLLAKNDFQISHVSILPNITTKSVRIKIAFNHLPQDNNYKIRIDITGKNHNHTVPGKEVALKDIAGELAIDVDMGNKLKTWSEFAPFLYQLTVSIVNKEGIIDTDKEIFGMREFSIRGKRFEINGIPTFLRGTTECCVFPLSGYPPTDVAEWDRIFSICKAFGLNHMRFHSYCPPEAAFSAADKAGFYLQVEGPSWAKYSVTLGDGKPIDNYLMDETKRIIDTYGNHPSFCMMAYGNEPSGHYVGYLEKWVGHFRKYDPQRVFTGASTGRSWAIIENSDYIVRSPPRGLNWSEKQPETRFDYRNKTENQERPYVTFEMGQWCAFPDFTEIKKYTGPLKARNFELFRDELDNHHMLDQAHDFLMASGKLQASCYKQEIEATLRTPNLAGFQLLALNDFPGQGTALVGVLDAFWDEKGYITAKEFKAFCDQVVPLARLRQFTYTNTDTLQANIEVANFSGSIIKNNIPCWTLTDNQNNTIKSGTFDPQDIPMGNCNHVGDINLPLEIIKENGKYTLQVKIDNFINHWDIWVYVPIGTPDIMNDIYICNALDEKAAEVLKQGGKVLLQAAGKVEDGKDVVQYFTPVFWNTSWFRMRPPHTTGLLIHDSHPIFSGFPTEYYSDFQWWGLANRCQVMDLENFPPGFRPIVQPIDTWFLNRRLAMLFEAKVYNGKLIVNSMELGASSPDPIVARQLLNSILKYMHSDYFDPQDSIDANIISELFDKKTRKSWDSYVKNNP